MTTTPESTTATLPLRYSPQVQGDILAGFRKDHTTVLFLHFTDAVKARAWLKDLVPRIATTAQVTRFNEEFKVHHQAAGGVDPEHLKVTWLNFSVTYPGLQMFTGKEQIFDDVPPETTLDVYRQGAAARAEINGDADDSAPERWSYGAGDGVHTVHGVLTLASDDDEELIHVIEQQKKAIAQAAGTVVFHQRGAVLPGELKGREHFGFMDGVSQPGVEGYDEPDPDDPTRAKDKPGTQMMPAGEFIIGYDRIDAQPPRPSYPEDKIPAWMRDGSFHVVRRLAQDVPGWWNQVEEVLTQLKEKGAVPEHTTRDWLAARMVGRWKNGTSLVKCPMAEPTGPQEPDNEFDYAEDRDGLTTPLFSHTRKSAPRAGLYNDGVQVREILNRRRRMIRRGSPYGKPIATDGSLGGKPSDERGMAFSCYQADIVGQFEFTQKRWITNDDNPQGRQVPAGPDPMICGMLTGISDGNIGFEGKDKADNRTSTQVFIKPFVTTQGTAYAFAPSLDTLRRLTEGRLEGDVPDIPTHDPFGARVDAMFPSPSRTGRYWSFQGQSVHPVTESKGSETTDLLAGPTHPIGSWAALHGVTRVDAVLPIHDEPRKYWVFFTGEDGAQHYRYIGVDDTGADTPGSSQAGANANPISGWESLVDVTHVDTIAPVPDAQPDAEGNHRYWVFHATPAGQRYRTIAIGPVPNHASPKISEDRPISTWNSLRGVETVDEIVPVPGKQRENGESWFWVFHPGGYRIIGVADGTDHTDRVVQQDRPLGEWNSPS